MGAFGPHVVGVQPTSKAGRKPGQCRRYQYGCMGAREHTRNKLGNPAESREATVEARSGPRRGVAPRTKPAPRRAVVTNARYLVLRVATSRARFNPRLATETRGWSDSIRNHSKQTSATKGKHVSACPERPRYVRHGVDLRDALVRLELAQDHPNALGDPVAA